MNVIYISFGADVMVGKTLQDAREILEHRRARLRDLIESDIPSPALRSTLAITLAEVEDRLRTARFDVLAPLAQAA